MPKPSPAPTPTTIKGTKGADHIVIGEAPHVYSPAQVARGFIIDGGNGDDFLAGGSGVDRVSGGAGFDVIVAQEEDILGAPAGTAAYDGGLDRDILDFSAWTKGVGIDLGSNNISGDRDYYWVNFQMESPSSLNQVSTNTGTLRGATVSIEGVIGGSANDSIGGDWGPNYIDGGGGDDSIGGEYGNDRLIGGAGNDLIFMATDNDIVTGDDPNNAAVEGNDMFMIGGGVVGSYFMSSITDYDTRTDASDTQYDRIWINKDFDWHFEADANGTLKLVYGVDYAGPLGEVTFTGLTLADASSVVVQGVDPMTGMPV